MMKKITSQLLVIFTFLLGAFSANSQSSVCLGTDATVCIGSSITIQNCAGTGSTGAIQLTNPQSFSLGDDDFTNAINIGFNFDFYGNTYNQFLASDNGIISFNTAQAGGYCSWVVTTLPSTTASAQNAICIPWQDLYMPAGGTIYTETIGTAPNRICVIYFDGLSLFSSQCQTASQCFTGSVLLYETSNIIETHISNKTTCAFWGSGTASHGLNNINGTIGHVVPGRNNSVWTAQNDGQRFTPTGPNSYSITPIPFQLVSTPSNNSLVWQNTLGQSFPYNNGNLIVNPVLPGTTGYFLSAATCGTGTGSVSADTTFITGVSSQVSASSTPDICSASQGTVTATPLSGVPTYTYSWPTLGGATTQTVTGVGAGTYQVIMTDGNGCSSTANVTVGDTPATFSSSTTDVSCPGGNDGTATAEMTPALGNITYQWDDPMMQTTQTATGLAAGTYNCTVTSDVGCSEVVTVTVTEIPGMVGVITSQSDVTCNSGNDGIIDVDVTQGTAPYTYSWDNSTSTSDVANDLAEGTHTVTVTDANGCVITITGTIGEPTPLSITSLTPDTQICPEDDIMLTAIGSGGSSPYTYTWTKEGTVIGTGATITVDPEVTHTQYCVTLSEACGSPTDDACMIVTFPTPIEPSAIVDEAEKCMPGRFEFTNTSANSAEIATSYWEFGPDGATLEIGGDSTHYQFNEVGVFDVIMTTTSIYGCVYTDTMHQMVEVKPNPIADFTFSSNPTTIFEPEVQMQDRSSVDVVEYNWYSPYSNPSASGVSDPKFYFPEEVGQYPVTLSVVTEHGCVDTLTLYLQVVQDILFFAPNSFTPDGDEFNQYWKPEIQGIDVYDFDLLIFNRWGEVIWENHDPSIGWDGTYKGEILQTGMYTWVARVKDLYNDASHEFSGTINLLK